MSGEKAPRFFFLSCPPPTACVRIVRHPPFAHTASSAHQCTARITLQTGTAISVADTAPRQSAELVKRRGHALDDVIIYVDLFVVGLGWVGERLCWWWCVCVECVFA